MAIRSFWRGWRSRRLKESVARMAGFAAFLKDQHGEERDGARGEAEGAVDSRRREG